MQLILNNKFGFCNFASFKNCNNCLNRLRCITYTPNQYINVTKSNEANRLRNIQATEAYNIQENLQQENLQLRQTIDTLNSQIMQLEAEKNELINNKTEITTPLQGSELQVYSNKNLEVATTTEPPLKAKKGLFGTKYVEDTSK